MERGVDRFPRGQQGQLVEGRKFTGTTSWKYPPIRKGSSVSKKVSWGQWRLQNSYEGRA